MYVESLALKDFRNYEVLDISLSPQTNIFMGDNAQGKTNILESLYMCATSKSFRGSRDLEMIRFGCEEAHLRGILYREQTEHRIDIHLRSRKTKGIAVDGRPIKSSGELFGMLHMVCFSPEDLSMIKNGPSERRHFIDMELCQLSRIYLHNLSSYNRIVNQRNILLKQIFFDRSLEDTLDVWDMQLASYGGKIIEERKQFTDLLNRLVSPVHSKLTGGKEKLSLIYVPCCQPDELEKMISGQREADLKRKTTGAGPHHDDLVFQIDGMDIRKFGSQGQQRTAVLSLKLAEIELVKQRINDTPVLLLDDVLSELDSLRQRYLLESIKNIQTVITCTGTDEFSRENVSAAKVYRVVNGKTELI